MKKIAIKKYCIFGGLFFLFFLFFFFLFRPLSDKTEEFNYFSLDGPTVDFSVIEKEIILEKEEVVEEDKEMPIVLEENKEEKPTLINISVPFTSQAPLAKWDDARQQDGCEEAVSVMAMAWVNGEGETEKIPPLEFEKRILDLSDFQQEKYSEFRDTGLEDILSWVFNDYFDYEKVEIKDVFSDRDILDEIEEGKIVLLPMAGRELKNPNFKAPGPPTHMILVKGYDYESEEFITNDPGTRLGADYRYPKEIVYQAIKVYPTGYHQEVVVRTRQMLIVWR
jgi:hypothetical protein